LYKKSDDSLCDSIYETDIKLYLIGELSLNHVISAVRADLLSENVLEIDEGEIEFFHQTLLEYAIACWLLRESGATELNHLINYLQESDISDVRFYRWHIIRQVLTIVKTAEKFEHIANPLIETKKIKAVRAVLLAAASRDKPSALLNLVPSVLALGRAYQEPVRIALESAPRRFAEEVWEEMLKLLQLGERKTVFNLARFIGEKLVPSKPSLGDYLESALDAIKKRTKEHAEVAGRLLQPCLPIIEQRVDFSALRALRKHYDLLGVETRAKVITFHILPSVEEREQWELYLKIKEQSISNKLWSQIITNGNNQKILVKDVIVDFAEKFFPINVEVKGKNFCNYCIQTLQNKKLPNGWDVVYSIVVGRYVVKNQYLLIVIFQELLKGNEKHIHRNLIAIMEAIRSGAGNFVVSELHDIIIESPLPRHSHPLAEIIKELANTLTEEQREFIASANWVKPLARNYPDNLIPALDALANGSKLVKQIVNELIAELEPQQQAQITKKLRSEVETKSQFSFVDDYFTQAITYDKAVKKLMEMSLGNKEYAFNASQAIIKLAIDYQRMSVQSLLLLAGAKTEGVRVNCLEAIIKMIESKLPVTEQEITTICTTLANENDPTVVRYLCKLVARWVRLNKQVPPNVAEVIGSIIERFHAEGTYEGGTARWFIAALKAIAQTDEQLLVPELPQWTRILLNGENLDGIRHGESEFIDLLCAINRFDPNFLPIVVKYDCPSLKKQGKEKNISAVIKAIGRVQKQKSKLFQDILARDWCTPEIENLISEQQEYRP
jgi:hypothetical protein